VFTGIVEEIGQAIETLSSRLSVTGNVVIEGLKLGDSIAINGICLTVVELAGKNFSLDVVPETLQKTNLGQLQPHDLVNLERAVAYGDRMGGHMVQGHGEGTGEVLTTEPDGNAIIMEISAPNPLMPYLVEKGFVAVDGASLTVVSVKKTSFSISLIPYTFANTTLGSRKPGDVVNLETDIVAKYVERLSQGQRGS
jgi:riboflavin synthase